MRFVASALTVAMLAASITFTSGVVAPGAAVAAPKYYCRAYAENKANRKAEKRLLNGAVLGVGLGLLTGAIVGGDHALTRGAIFGGIGGTTLSGVKVNKKWRKNYRKAYLFCRNHL